jgi:hypothetical protein
MIENKSDYTESRIQNVRTSLTPRSARKAYGKNNRSLNAS